MDFTALLAATRQADTEACLLAGVPTVAQLVATYEANANALQAQLDVERAQVSSLFAQSVTLQAKIDTAKAALA